MVVQEILENKAKVEESAADQEVERPEAYINLPGLQVGGCNG